MKISTYIIIPFLIVIFVLLPLILFVMNRLTKKLVYFFFFFYLLIVFIGVLFKIDIDKDIITIYFESSGKFLDLSKFILYNFSFNNVFINICMFFPFGMYFFIIFNKRFLYSFLCSFLLSFIIESLQLILPIQRTPELTDLLYNSLSGILGYCFLYFINKIKIKV
jgi:glycopeptide antibiotics resistance protein